MELLILKNVDMAYRCAIVRPWHTRIKRRTGRPIWSANLTAADYYNIAKYFLYEPRINFYFEYSGRERRLPIRDKENPFQEISSIGTQESLAQCGDEMFGVDARTGGSPTNANGKNNRNGGKKNQGIKRRRSHSEEELVYEFLKRFPTSPLENIVGTQQWISSEFKWYDKIWPPLEAATHLLNVELCQMSTIDYIKWFENVKPIFSQPIGDTGHYFTLEESFILLEKLLWLQVSDFESYSSFKFPQTNDSKKDKQKIRDTIDVGESRVRGFVTMLYYIVDKKWKKMNTLQITAPPSSGKNFFFDAILDFYINQGNIGNFNRYNQFPLQDAVNRRINLWNEPNIEPGQHDTLKMLTGGDSMNVKIKRKADVKMLRTPLIILTNKNVIPRSLEFADRVYKCEWSKQPWLKNHSKMPNPLAWIKILFKYCTEDEFVVWLSNYNNKHLYD